MPEFKGLYPHQQTLVNKIKQSFSAGYTRPMVQASTGFGKAVVAGSIIRSAVDKNKINKIVLIVDSLTLVDQLIETFEDMFGLSVGVIQGINSKTDLSKQVQIATPQTLTRRFAQDSERGVGIFINYDVGLVIVDESHMKHKGIKEALDYWDCHAIGFTATPYAKGLGLVFDDLVHADSLQELMDRGDLAKYKAFSHKQPDLTGLKIGANGDLVGADERYDSDLIADVVETWRDKASDRLTIGFAPTIAKCEAFATLFRANGIEAQAVHSKYSAEDSDNIIKKFKKGEIRVLWSVAKLIKGFDVPEVSCIIDAQPTASLMRHIQKIGRALRKYDGKEYALILDHAGNFIRNGLCEDAYIEELDDGTTEKGENPDRKDPKNTPIECPDCGQIHEKFKTDCDVCGHHFEKKTESVTIDDDINWEDGELVEFVRTGNNKEYTPEQKMEFFGGLKLHAQKARFKSGWAAYKYKEFFGVWPNAYKDAKMCNVTPEVQKFIYETQKRRAK